MISKACKYGIRAVVFVASRTEAGLKLNVRDISREVDAPEAFTAKILQVLSKHQLISSLKGPYGGFYLTDAQLELPLLQIVEAIDGMTIFKECGLGLKQCSEVHPCPMHDRFKAARETLKDVFAKTTVRQLALELKEGTSFITNLA
jgi:Rrf2 family transcriptional regulator, iron-sulfur cluster assembly transcription factor